MMTVSQYQQGMPLAELLAGLDSGFDGLDSAIRVNGLQLDSRQVKGGDLFVACQGASANGQDFIEQAAQQGAVAVLTDAVYSHSAVVPILVLPEAIKYLSQIAGRFYGQPSAQQRLIGVTGTNGKTSCTQFMMQLLSRMQKSCGVIGTLGMGIDGQLQVGINTTPDAIAIQKTLAGWQGQVDCVAMEVSSHGLAQSRVAGLHFDVAAFTNLSRDHLDYHGDMASYGAEKARLFKQAGLKHAVINVDDEFSATLIETLATDVNVVRYSTENHDADVYASEIKYHERGVSAVIHSPWGELPLSCALLGCFNLSNVLAAISCLAVEAYDFASLVAAAHHLQPVAGRMDILNTHAGTDEPTIVIDYAHTPDALEHTLTALRAHVGGKLHCVFGCGGDRDQGKRPLMGAIASRLADVTWVTSDNPRTENAQTIIEHIMTAIPDTNKVYVEADRALVIEKVILAASADDVILIAGKGHENYQQIGEQRLPFNDAKQARLGLIARQTGGPRYDG